MTSYGGQERQDQKDSLLLYEAGFKTQLHLTSSASQVSCSRLNRTYSLILRVLEWLRMHNPKYDDLNEWRIHHIPHKRGQRIYRPLSTSDSIKDYPDGIKYLEDLIRYDAILRKMRIVSTFLTENDEDTLYFFPGSGATEKSGIPYNMRIDPRDLLLVDELARIFGPQVDDDIDALATCPSEKDCLNSQRAQLNFWLECIENAEACLNPLDFGGYTEQTKLQNNLKSAFERGHQIHLNRSLFNISARAANRIYYYAKEREYEEDDFRPLMEIIDNKIESDRVNRMLEIADIMSALVGLCEDLLLRINIVVGLSDQQRDWVKHHYSVLSQIGISDEAIRSARNKSFFHPGVDIPRFVAEDIITFLKEMKSFLANEKLLSQYQPLALVNPELLVLK